MPLCAYAAETMVAGPGHTKRLQPSLGKILKGSLAHMSAYSLLVSTHISYEPELLCISLDRREGQVEVREFHGQVRIL